MKEIRLQNVPTERNMENDGFQILKALVEAMMDSTQSGQEKFRISRNGIFEITVDYKEPEE